MSARVWTIDREDAVRACDLRSELGRRLLAQGASEWDATAAKLVLGELIGNAVRYGSGSTIEVRFDLKTRMLRIAVTDGGSGFVDAPPGCEDPLAENGRGLDLIRQVSRSIRWTRTDRGFCVEVDLGLSSTRCTGTSLRGTFAYAGDTETLRHAEEKSRGC